MQKSFFRHIALTLFLIFPGFIRSQDLPPGWDFTITNSFHPIAIPLSADPSLFEEPIEPGDYIGVFFIRNDSLICAGASEWLGDENIAVVAFGDDNMTTFKDGFYVGETINWKIYSWDYGDDFPAAAAYDPAMPNSDGKFYPGGLSALLSLSYGFAFGAEASAEPDTICIGGYSQLTAIPSGGSGNYSYLWTSDPPGYSSTLQNPLVSPTGSASYFLEIFDGYRTATDTTMVEVVQLPQSNAGEDISICEDSDASLAGTASGFSSHIWTTNGDGTFGDEASLITTYTPGEADKTTGLVKLTLKAFAMSPCSDSAVDFLFLTVTLLPVVDAGDDDVICEGEDYTLGGSATHASSVLWSTSGDGTFEDPEYLATTYGPGPEDIAAGQVILTLAGMPQPPCGEEVTDGMLLSINTNPQVDAGPDQTIPHGTFTQLNGTVQGGSGSFTYSWTPAEFLLNPSAEDPTTENLYQSVEFTLTGTDANTSCLESDKVTVFITGGPLSVEANAQPNVVCTGNPVQLSALPSGGSGEYFFAWTSDPPGFESELQDPVAYPEETTSYTVVINDGFNTNSDEVTVTVFPPPLANAGSDITIPYGTHTILDGTATGGSGMFSYSWSPPQYFVDPNTEDPVTVNLTQSVDFRLLVTDLTTLCQDMDSVSVFITGGPLQLSITATPNQVCLGDSSQLLADASGGSGFYWYSWTSDPPGFVSSLPNPVVYPETSTDYFVTVTDNYTTIDGFASVEVFPLPQVSIQPFPDDTVCAGEWITLDATVQGGIGYLWQPGGLTGPVIEVDSTGIGFGSVVYTVTVTTLDGCSGEDSVEVTFFNCVGIDEDTGQKVRMHIYPNPAAEQLTIWIDPATFTTQPVIKMNSLRLEIVDINGRIIQEIDIQADEPVYLTSVSSFSPGIYLVLLRDSGRVLARAKIVVR